MLDVAALYEQHRMQVIGFVRHRLPRDEQDEVDDLVNEAFIRAFKAAPRYVQRGEQPVFWLYRIARNLIIDRHRRQVRRVDETPLDFGMDGAPTTLDAGSPRHDDILLARSLLESLRSEQPRQATVLELRFLHGLEITEVAARLGVERDSVNKLQARGLARIRKIAAGDLSRFGGLAAVETRQCPCGTVFETGKRQVYCSRRCRQRASDLRRKAAA